MFYIPEKAIQSRWKTLKDCYTKLVKAPKSGSSPKPLTERNKYILRKLAFVRDQTDARKQITSNLAPVQAGPTNEQREVSINKLKMSIHQISEVMKPSRYFYLPS